MATRCRRFYHVIARLSSRARLRIDFGNLRKWASCRTGDNRGNRDKHSVVARCSRSSFDSLAFSDWSSPNHVSNPPAVLINFETAVPHQQYGPYLGRVLSVRVVKAVPDD